MTDNDENQIREVISISPGSIWGYWPFIFPVLMVLVGAAFQVALLIYFENKVPGLEVWLKHGDKFDRLWDSQLVKLMVLTVSLSITVTFGLIAFLARRAFKQVRLLKIAAAELQIDKLPSDQSSNGRWSFRPE